MSNELQKLNNLTKSLIQINNGIIKPKDLVQSLDFMKKAELAKKYAKLINAETSIVNTAMEAKLRMERDAGKFLKDTIKHGGGRPNKNSLHDARGLTKLSDLGVEYTKSHRWQQIYSIPEHEFNDEIEALKKAEKEITTQYFLRKAKDIESQKQKNEIIKRLKEKPLPMLTENFDVIVIDPPWAYQKRKDDVTHRSRCPYPDMSIDEIKNINIQKYASENCILWLWTTNAFMRYSFEILDCWGFQEKTILTWVKDKMGLGDWLRGQTEHCIMAIKGKPVINLTNQTTVFYGKIREHSRKPDEFFDLINNLCPGSKLEFFAREKRKGWQTIGIENDKF